MKELKLIAVGVLLVPVALVAGVAIFSGLLAGVIRQCWLWGFRRAEARVVGGRFTPDDVQ